MRTRYSTRRRRNRYGRRLRKLLHGCCAICCFALAIHLLALLLPLAHNAAQRLALLSAGIPTAQTDASISASVSETASSTPEQAIKPLTASSIVSAPSYSGTIKREQFYAGAAPLYIPLKNGAAIKNMTRLAFDTVQAEAAKAPAFKINGNGKPEVLILHTHATESYESETRDSFDPARDTHSADKTANVIYVGDKIETALRAAGIGVLHDFTLHDQPTDADAYARSAETIRKYLKKYPTIKVVLDVGRDAIHESDTTRTAPTVTVDGRSAAQVMLISGCDDGTMGFPHFYQNLRLTARLAEQAEADHKGLMRPTLFDYRNYNQSLSPGALHLEIGSDANSLDEAAYAGSLVGESLAKVLTSLK